MRRLLIAAAALLFAAAALRWAAPQLWPVDRCLDAGGRWDTAAQICLR